MIVTGEDEVDSRFLSDSWEVIADEAVDRIGIGSVCGDMHGQDLPLAGGVLGIVNEPIKCCLILTGCGVVNDCDIDIAVLNGVVAAVTGSGEIVHGVGDGASVITVEFVVAENMDEIDAAHGLSVENGGQSIPVDILGTVVNGVAGLDSKVVCGTVFAERIKDTLYALGIGGLGIADNEEVSLGGILVHAEAQNFALSLTVTYCVVVGSTTGKTGKLNGGYTSGFCGEVDKLSGADILGVCGIGVCGGILGVEPEDCLILGCAYIGQPGDVLAAGSCGVILNIVGSRSVFTGKSMHGDALIPGAHGNTVIGEFVCISIDCSGGAEGHADHTLIVGDYIGSETVNMDGGTLDGQTELVLNEYIECIADNSGLYGDAVVRLNGNAYGGEAEAVGKAAFGDRGKCSGGNAVSECGTSVKGIGGVEGDDCYLSIVGSGIGLFCGEGKLAAACVIGVVSGEAFRKCYGGFTECGVEFCTQSCGAYIDHILCGEGERVAQTEIGGGVAACRNQSQGGI